MSTRYVWGKYSVKNNWTGTVIPTKCYPIPYSAPINTSEFFSGYLGSGVTFEDGKTVTQSEAPCGINNAQSLIAQTRIAITNANAWYTPYMSGNRTFAVARDNAINAFYWYVQPNYETGSGWALTCVTEKGTQIDVLYRELTARKGDFIHNVSDSTANKYPTVSGGGVLDDYWYIYKDSDTIDPTAVSYPTAQLRPGDSMTVTASPGTPTYGGTISYLYQYRINGGSWTDIRTTTATSINFTIPANAKTIQFRVRAQDDMGFTSTTYVTGESVAVERLNAWVGINNKARKGVELYVGVNGKARKVTAAYIGVNDKARRFL